eukprot:COSAG01_NODE_21580_length_895_cov_1.015075_1_plen_95_part_00
MHEGVSLWGGEVIYRNGERVGHITSAGIGHTVNAGRAIGIGYVNVKGGGRSVRELKALVMAGDYELAVPGGRVAVEVTWDALYDPQSKKMRDVE